MAIPPTKEIVTLLSASDAFSGTPERELNALAELFTERSVYDGEVITEEDATGGDVYLVLDGLFRVITGADLADDDDEDSGGDDDDDGFGGGGLGLGASAQVRLLQRGDVFGEIAAMTGGRRMATVRAASEGRLLVLGKDDFHRVLKNSPEMVESICNSMARYFDED
ncbi:MAG: cyclic nucleotide-binding domain-containing protein [Verrucomicrobiales bacterium]|nr:cyclic nucleotide-binding domain-containing protein [Verrucomicrobiae bacterium]